ncbi:MAG: septation protein A [Quisquiliibacterium sp.]
MKLLFDLLPVLLFFIAFKVADIYVATGVAIVTSFVQIAWLKLRAKSVETVQWVSLGIIVVFGGMTLLLHDETFIKWKPSVLYGFFALALLIARLVMRRNLIQIMMGKQIKLPALIWDRLNIAWILFFGFMACLNLFVAYRFDTETWVNFKLFGTMGLTLVFVLAQAVYFSRHLIEEKH